MKHFLLSSLILSALLLINRAHAQTSNVSLDLLWEADTYTPSFYNGHSQISPESTVKVIALPVVSTGDSINQVKVNDYQFDWTKDNFKISSYSGRGKNFLVYQAGASGSNVVKVTISDSMGHPIASNQLVLPVTKPKLVFYREDPLSGAVYNQALGGTFNLTLPEVTLRAEPYFFSAASVLRKSLNFNWQIDGQKVVSNPDDQQLVTFAAPKEGSGQNTISLGVDNPGSAFQDAKEALDITFNQQNIGF